MGLTYPETVGGAAGIVTNIAIITKIGRVGHELLIFECLARSGDCAVGRETAEFHG